ncbi:MAG: hypothetical protein Q9157_000654 [Trypethelium eluteriae]
MARLNLHRSSSLRPESRSTTSRRPAQQQTLSPSPATSSDKENHDEDDQDTPRRGGQEKAVMGPPKLPTPNSDTAGHRSAKRRRLDQSGSSSESGEDERQPPREQDVKDIYDPDQPMEERQQLRKSLRELHRDLSDNRDEFVQARSGGLLDIMHKANSLYAGVRQTSDATIDSRLLVTIGDYTSKRADLLAHGAGALGVDVDEFVSKCITFMRHGGPLDDEDNSTTTTNHATPAPRRHGTDISDDEDENGDALDWDVLGPLAVQKRVRAPIQRRARQSKKNDGPVAQPELLEKEDLRQQENSSLVKVCKRIRDVLVGHLRQGEELEEKLTSGEIEEEEAGEEIARLRLADTGEVGLFDFVVNPHSFGQTVENIFYVSFLIKEGSIRVGEDSNGLPTLGYEEARTIEEQRANQVTKHQAVFAIDFDTWEQLIDVFQIREPLIPHRAEDHATQPTARGWYG